MIYESQSLVSYRQKLSRFLYDIYRNFCKPESPHSRSHRPLSFCDRELWPMTLTLELDLDSVEMK